MKLLWSQTIKVFATDEAWEQLTDQELIRLGDGLSEAWGRGEAELGAAGLRIALRKGIRISPIVRVD